MSWPTCPSDPTAQLLTFTSQTSIAGSHPDSRTATRMRSTSVCVSVWLSAVHGTLTSSFDLLLQLGGLLLPTLIVFGVDLSDSLVLGLEPLPNQLVTVELLHWHTTSRTRRQIIVIPLTGAEVKEVVVLHRGAD
mmetsp:Transcript_11616/g.33812  ORF Transcript_11616/g.33812 Transcript_11616/m.33812 type:complete len:134 (-) Transcript_11616:856-1257(-)